MPPPVVSDSPPVASQARWFSAEVQVHDASLRSYLRGSFPAVRDVDDVVQESYLRTWIASATQPIRSVRAFLFTVARRLALDHVRRERRSPIDYVGHSGALPAVVEPVDDLARRERVRLLAEAIAGLPPRCRDAFLAYKVRGLPRKSAAAELGLSEKTIESHTAKAMRHCEAFFRRRGMRGAFDDESR